MTERDPYQYFRTEAREIVERLGTRLRAAERGESVATDELFRLAHTLKGAARLVRVTAVADLAHTMEDVFALARERGTPVDPREAAELLQLVAALGAELASLPPPPTTTTAPGPVATVEEFAAVRVATAALDELSDGVAESEVQLAALRESRNQLDHVVRLAEQLEEQVRALSTPSASRAPSRALSAASALRVSLADAVRAQSTALGRMGHELSQLRATTAALRVLPVRIVLPALEMAVRDAAHAQGKRALFESAGADAGVDAPVLARVRDALLHLVRNAVAHGIETPDERVSRGKPEEGSVRLTVERRGGRVSFACRDDGRGVDAVAVRRAAVARGLLAESEARTLSDDAAMELMFASGLSTARAVDSVAGRGVGLDVVRAAVAELNGSVRVHTLEGRGTTVELEVPASVTSFAALRVESAGISTLVPLDAVARTARVPNARVSRGAAGSTVMIDDAAVPFAPLAALLGDGSANAPAPTPTTWSVVVLRAGERRAALGVDRLAGTRDVVVRPLPPAVGTLPLVAGAAFDAHGDPVLLLDAAGVCAALHGSFAPMIPPPARAERPLVLVVDDSLTTRMLEQSVLESAGYRVEVAASALEALDRATPGRYGLFIIDVEMPGMSGLEFAARVRRDPGLSRVPIIMVTSLGADEDRRRGLDAGVDAYFVKSEFDQERFLAQVSALVG